MLTVYYEYYSNDENKWLMDRFECTRGIEDFILYIKNNNIRFHTVIKTIDSNIQGVIENETGHTFFN